MSGEEGVAEEVTPTPPPIVVDCIVRKLSGSTIQHNKCTVGMSNGLLIISDGKTAETTYVIRNIEGWDTTLSD